MYLLPNATCAYSCPSASYVDSTANKCLNCHPWCLTCWGPLNTQCSRCNNVTSSSNQVTIYYLISGMGTCSQTCPDSQYIDAKVPNYCQLCSSSCLTCATSSSNCVSCQTGNYYLNGACYPSCPTGNYSDSTTSQCLSCNSACASCVGSGVNNCLSCKTLYFLSYGTNSCVSACPTGQFANSTSNLCLPCNALCTTCSLNSTNCVTCSFVNLIIPAYLFNNTCV